MRRREMERVTKNQVLARAAKAEDTKDTHSMQAQKDAQMDKFAKAFGVEGGRNRREGEVFDRDLMEQKKADAAKERDEKARQRQLEFVKSLNVLKIVFCFSSPPTSSDGRATTRIVSSLSHRPASSALIDGRLPGRSRKLTWTQSPGRRGQRRGQPTLSPVMMCEILALQSSPSFFRTN